MDSKYVGLSSVGKYAGPSLWRSFLAVNMWGLLWPVWTVDLGALISMQDPQYGVALSRCVGPSEA